MDSITKQIEQVAENICDNFCKYRDTCDENCECEWLRNGNECPLAKLCQEGRKHAYKYRNKSASINY